MTFCQGYIPLAALRVIDPDSSTPDFRLTMTQPPTAPDTGTATKQPFAPPFTCPSCGAGQHRLNRKCIRCGIALTDTPPPDDEPSTSPALSKEAWRALGIGFGLAFVIHLVPFTRILFAPLSTIIHEIGHAAAAWSYGYQAVPAFDFSEGGGVTMIPEERSTAIVVGIYLLFAVLVWRTRKHLPTALAVLILAAAHSSLMWSPVHQGVILGMGHAMEMVFAAIFLYRAMTGTTLLQADERPAYAMVGFLMLLDRLSFFYRLSSDRDFQEWYSDGKSYADNDLVRIADSFWNTPVSHMAQIFVLLCLLMPVVARLFYRYEGPMWMWASRFAAPEKDETD
jgi:hypothetical protein